MVRFISAFGHLAQVNIALAREPLDAPLLAEFMAALAPVNARAEAAPGFVWRMQTEDGDATTVRGFGEDPRLIINLTTWKSLAAMREFVYRDPGHLAVMRRRREWFERVDLHTALWWVPAGNEPSVAEAEERLNLSTFARKARRPTRSRFAGTLRPTIQPSRSAMIAGSAPRERRAVALTRRDRPRS